MGAIAIFPPLRSTQTKRSAAPSKTRNLPLIVSLVLHAAVVVVLIYAIPHRLGAPLPKKAFTVISLQSLVQATPIPSVELPHLPPPAPPRRHRPAPAKVAAASPTWHTPPAPTLQPPPSPAQAATAPAPPAPTPDPAPQPAVVAASAASAAAPAASGSAAEYAAMPIAYLTEVSRMIRVNLNPPREAHRHGGIIVAIVHIRIARDGTVLGAGVTQSTGIEVLDREALGVVLRIHKFPEPPGEFFPFTIDQPIRFIGT